MLALTRKVGQTIHIGEDVVIHVKEMSGKRILLAIDAPKSIPILRGELLCNSNQQTPLSSNPIAFSTAQRDHKKRE